MAETIDQQFIEYIVKALVGNPEAVKVNRTIDEKGVLLELYVDQNDLGRVIGRNGATAKSIRILLRALGVKNDARYNLKIVDTNPDGSRREPDQTPVVAAEPQDQPDKQPVAASDEPAVATSEDTEQPVEVATAETETEPEATEEPEKSQIEDEPADVVRRSREELKDLTDFDV